MSTCAKCNRSISGTVVTALDKKWHNECFTCYKCPERLSGKQFFTDDNGHPYCEIDWKICKAKRCSKCYEAIVGEVVTALDKTWHPHCFVCTRCRKPFGSDGFMVKNDKPYCKKDYQDLFHGGKEVKAVADDICYGCDQKIASKWTEALGHNWHPECFVCTKCRKTLTGEKFYNVEGKPICTTCG
ncbi:paxillin homolog 1-like [Glandiceps talaboti]